MNNYQISGEGKTFLRIRATEVITKEKLHRLYYYTVRTPLHQETSLATINSQIGKSRLATEQKGNIIKTQSTLTNR